MPSSTRKQQAFFGAVKTCKETGKCPTKAIKEAASSMTIQQINDYLRVKK